MAGKPEFMQTTVILPVRQIEQLREIAGREYIARGPRGRVSERPSVSRVIQRALDQYLGEAKA